MKVYIGQLLIATGGPSIWNSWNEATNPDDVVGKLTLDEVCLCVEGPKDIILGRNLLGIKILTSSGLVGWTYEDSFDKC